MSQAEMFTAGSTDSGSTKPTPANSNPVPDTDDFKWGADNEDVIVQDQPATAVYSNACGGVVIRQERAWDEEEDSYVFFNSPEVARKVVAAILRQLGDVE